MPAFTKALTGAGVLRDDALFLISIFHPVREGWAAVAVEAVQTLTGDKLLPLRACAQEHLADLAA